MYGSIGFYSGPDDAYCRVCFDIMARAEGWDADDAIAIFPDTETDTPTHCVRCEDLIEHALTSDGYDYVGEAIVRAAHDDGRKAIVRAWFDIYADGIDRDYLAEFTSATIEGWPERDKFSPVVVRA